jgi:hypothetical protein
VLGEQLAPVVDGNGGQQLALLLWGQQPPGQQGPVEAGVVLEVRYPLVLRVPDNTVG